MHHGCMGLLISTASKEHSGISQPQLRIEEGDNGRQDFAGVVYRSAARAPKRVLSSPRAWPSPSSASSQDSGKSSYGTTKATQELREWRAKMKFGRGSAMEPAPTKGTHYPFAKYGGASVT